MVIPNLVYFVIAMLLCVMMLILLVTVQPFKESVKYYFTINVTFLLFMSMFLTDLLAIQGSKIWSPETMPFLLTLSIAIGAVDLLYTMAVLIYYYIHRCLYCILVPIRRVQTWRRGYRLL